MKYKDIRRELEEKFESNEKGFNGRLYDKLKYMYLNSKELITNYCYLDSIRLDLSDNYLNNNVLYSTIKEELDYTIELIFNKYKNNNNISFEDVEDLNCKYLTYYYNIIKY